MTPGGLPYAVAWLCWAVAFVTNGALLLRVAPRLTAARVIRTAIAAIIGAIALLVAVILGIAAVGAHPPPATGSLLFSALFTVIVLGMTNSGSALFRGAADTITAFHVQHNAANLHRFPISVLIEHRRWLDRFATVVWSLGSGLMLYGVWFDMQG